MHTANELAILLITIGGVLLLGLATEAIGRHTRLPRVTLLLIFGCVIGPPALDFLPQFGEAWFEAVSAFALIMIGFLLGGKLTLITLRRHGRSVLWVSIAVVLVTAFVMTAGLMAAGFSIVMALLFAGIATATDPAATIDVIHETQADGPFSRILLGIVAIDDAWGLMMFSLLLVAAQAFSGQGGHTALLVSAVREIGGAVLLGGVLGIPMAYLSGRIKKGEPTQAEALGMVLLCGGLAMWLDVSFLLASMALGAVVVNLARHHKRPFHAIEQIEGPFLILFFVLAGASLQLDSLAQIGLTGTAYVALRILGRIAGAWIGGICGMSNPLYRRWMGVALMPQAGVALGMALLGVQRFPELKETLLPVVIGATVLFEILGPVMTRLALVKTGEAGLELI